MNKDSYNFLYIWKDDKLNDIYDHHIDSKNNNKEIRYDVTKIKNIVNFEDVKLYPNLNSIYGYIDIYSVQNLDVSILKMIKEGIYNDTPNINSKIAYISNSLYISDDDIIDNESNKNNNDDIDIDDIDEFIGESKQNREKLLRNFINLEKLWFIGNNDNFLLLELPKTLKHMVLNINYIDKPFKNLPQDLELLSIWCHKNHHQDMSFYYLDRLYGGCGCHFDVEAMKIMNNLPPKLKTLVIGSCTFNEKLNNLPNELEYLGIVGVEFDRPITHLPNGLKYLLISCWNFNQSIDHLPDGLITLVINSTFDQPIKKLPSSLETLYLQIKKFDQEIDNLPKSLKELTIRTLNFKGVLNIENLPKNINIKICDKDIFRNGIFLYENVIKVKGLKIKQNNISWNQKISDKYRELCSML